jgi:hypothetical protein
MLTAKKADNMGIFKTIESTLGNLRRIAQEYLETQVELLKVQAAEKLSALLSNIIAYLVLVFFLLFFLLFASAGLAWVISAWIGKTYAGFFIVGGFYLLIGLIIFKSKEGLLRKPLRNAIIRQLFNDKP